MCVETRPTAHLALYNIICVQTVWGSQTREYREQLRPFFVAVGPQRVATGRNESQRVATGVQLLAFAC